ncbi:Translin [Nymphaea thermarum]|nr:Translin [Nymphaea thermarum]
MRALFRTALLSVLFKTHGHKFPGLPSAHHRRFSLFLVGKLREAPRGRAFFCCSATMGDGGSSMERQFEDFRTLLDDSGSVRERIRSVVSEVESVARVMQSNLLLVHHALVSPGKCFSFFRNVLEKAKVQISTLQTLFKQLSDIIGERPGQYYRYHGDWRGETQSVVSSLAFLHWLETENLLTHAEAEEKLGCTPRFVVNQVTAGNYDCPSKVLKFLTDLHAAFRLLNLRNDFLRKKFDSKCTFCFDLDGANMLLALINLILCRRLLSVKLLHLFEKGRWLRPPGLGLWNLSFLKLGPSEDKILWAGPAGGLVAVCGLQIRLKYDLRRVEEVYYDVKIRGLGGDSVDNRTEGGKS